MIIENYKRANMCISRKKGKYKTIDGAKVLTGSFNTVHGTWCQPQIISFISDDEGINTCLDPFAGDGHLLEEVERRCPNIRYTMGYDIKGEKWLKNDSLVHVPVEAPNQTIIVTNPPFLAKHSAKRKGVYEAVGRYYENSERNDLYQIALDKCREAVNRVVAILPETFINSGYGFNGVVSCTILKDSPFTDTEHPVCVVCIDREFTGDASFFLDERFLLRWSDINNLRLVPKNKIQIVFNAPNGKIGFRAVDGHSPEDRISFHPREEFLYQGDILTSSRLMTFVDIPSLESRYIETVCSLANRFIEDYRKQCKDILLSPFKGNNSLGFRRRRLDYRSARAILEMAVAEVCDNRIGRLL